MLSTDWTVLCLQLSYWLIPSPHWGHAACVFWSEIRPQSSIWHEPCDTWLVTHGDRLTHCDAGTWGARAASRMTCPGPTWTGWSSTPSITRTPFRSGTRDSGTVTVILICFTLNKSELSSFYFSIKTNFSQCCDIWWHRWPLAALELIAPMESWPPAHSEKYTQSVSPEEM